MERGRLPPLPSPSRWLGLWRMGQGQLKWERMGQGEDGSMGDDGEDGARTAQVGDEDGSDGARTPSTSPLPK